MPLSSATAIKILTRAMEVVGSIVSSFLTPCEKELLQIVASRGFIIESQNKTQIKRQLFSVEST